MRRLAGPRAEGQVIAALVAGLFLLPACTATDEANAPVRKPDELPRELIAFSADVNGGWDFYEGDADVFVINPEGGTAQNLTRHPANDFSPEWSPDGERIAFRTDRDGNHEIYAMNANGSDPVNLTRTPDAEERSPAWSPDGAQIAFSSNRDGDRDIYLMAADGSDVARLALPGLQEYPTWSPDGAEIAFTSYCSSCSNAALLVMNVDGTNPREIATSAGWPDWSPDGSVIAYDTRAEDGTLGVHTIAPTTGATPKSLVRGLQGDWSPDGGQLAYAVETGTLEPGKSTLLADLYMAAADGKEIRQLTRTPRAFEFEPTWRPTASDASETGPPSVSMAASSPFISMDPSVIEARYRAGVNLFEYDPSLPLRTRKGEPNRSSDVTVRELTYVSPLGGRVSAVLAKPDAAGPLGGVILLHGLPSNRFGLARLGNQIAGMGAIVLMIDAPWAREENLGRPEGQITLTPIDREEQIQLIVDLRRGIDLLLQEGADPDRLGYLGVSYGGAMGGLFAGVEHRLRTAVLVVGDGGLVSHFTLTSDPTLPWARVPPIQRRTWVSAMEPIEPIYFVGYAAPTSLLFQNGIEDQLVPPNAALQYQEAGSEPKEARWYRAGHSLNPEAECDQLEWLDHSLRLVGTPDPFLCPQGS
jgi:Tol biopolymer transport system component/cephalosporin-C deacetylase-like acetyl esterase